VELLSDPAKLVHAIMLDARGLAVSLTLRAVCSAVLCCLNSEHAMPRIHVTGFGSCVSFVAKLVVDFNVAHAYDFIHGHSWSFMVIHGHA
jgi:hypothetical protein